MKVAPANKSLLPGRIGQVSRLFGRGLVVKEVAQQLGISVNTVMSYARRIKKQNRLVDLHQVYVWCVEREVRRKISARCHGNRQSKNNTNENKAFAKYYPHQ